MVICAYQFLRYGVALDLKSHRAHPRVTWMPVIPDAGPTSWPEFGRGFVLQAEICHSARLHTRPSTKDAPRRRHSAARHVMPPTEPKQAMSAPTSPRVTRARSQRARQRSPSTEHRIVPDTRPSHRAVTGQQGPGDGTNHAPKTRCLRRCPARSWPVTSHVPAVAGSRISPFSQEQAKGSPLPRVRPHQGHPARPGWDRKAG